VGQSIVTQHLNDSIPIYYMISLISVNIVCTFISKFIHIMFVLREV